MITSVRITNYVGTKTEIVLDKAYPEHGMMITNIDGLGPSAATIAKQAYGIVNGSFISSVKFEQKNIVITFRLSESEGTVERARLNVYETCPQGTRVNLEFRTDLGYAYFIDGIVESIEPNVFSDKEEVKVSIICENPFFSRRLLKTPSTGTKTKIMQGAGGAGPNNNSGENAYCLAEYIMQFPSYMDPGISITSGYIGFHFESYGSHLSAIIVDMSKFALLLPDKHYIMRGDKIAFYYNPTTGEKYIKYYEIKMLPEEQHLEDYEWYDPWDITSCEDTTTDISPYERLGTVLFGDPESIGRVTGVIVTTNGGNYYAISIDGFVVITYPASIEDGGGSGDYEDEPEHNFSSGSCIVTNNGNIEGGGVWTTTFSTQIDLTADSAMYFYDDQNHNIHVNLYKVMILYANAIGDVTLPMRILADDVLTISTVDRNKYVRFTRNSITILVLDACGTVDFDWPRIYPGENTLRIEGITSSKYGCVLTFDHLFGGV